MNKHYREPIKHTCPDIDDAIRECKSFYMEMDAKLEDLRRCNESLREWGIEEASRVDELESLVEGLEKELSNAKGDIQYLTNTIESLEREAAEREGVAA